MHEHTEAVHQQTAPLTQIVTEEFRHRRELDQKRIDQEANEREQHRIADALEKDKQRQAELKKQELEMLRDEKLKTSLREDRTFIVKTI